MPVGLLGLLNRKIFGFCASAASSCAGVIL